MDDSLRPFRALSREIHGRLVPHEDIIYRLEDVLLFRYPARAVFLFVVVNLVHVTVVWLLRPSLTTALLGLAVLLSVVRYFWVRRPRARLVTRMLRPFVERSVTRLEGVQRRFDIAEVTAFAVAALWGALQVWRDAAAAARKRDLHAIARFALGFMAAFTGFAMLGDAAVLSLAINGGLLLPWICSRLNG